MIKQWGNTLKAVSYDRFGDAGVLQFADLPEPVAGRDDVLVAIEARSVNLIDIRVRKGMLGPLVNKRFPKVPGADFAGMVLATGRNVRDLPPGTRVFGAAGPFRGGAFAERIAVPAAQVAPVPTSLSGADAATLPIAGLAALQSLRDLGRLAPGNRVLVHGATGPVGLMAVQIAKHLGAQVTAVGGAGLDVARALGADALVDYRDGEAVPRGAGFDVILNASGKMPYVAGLDLLVPDGRLIEPSPTIPLFLGSRIGNLFRRRKHLALATQIRRADLVHLAKLVGDGTIRTVIAASLPFERSLEALAMVEKGGVVGKVVVTR